MILRVEEVTELKIVKLPTCPPSSVTHFAGNRHRLAEPVLDRCFECLQVAEHEPLNLAPAESPDACIWRCMMCGASQLSSRP